MKKIIFIVVLFTFTLFLGACQSSIKDYQEKLRDEGWYAASMSQRGDINFDVGFPESRYPNLITALQATYTSSDDVLTIGTIYQFKSSSDAEDYYQSLGEEALESGNVRVEGKYVFYVFGPMGDEFFNALGLE